MGSVTGSVDLAGCERLQYHYAAGLMAQDRPGSFTMWRYRELLPVADGPVRYPVPVGGTPLLPAPALRRRLGTPRPGCGPSSSCPPPASRTSWP